MIRGCFSLLVVDHRRTCKWRGDPQDAFNTPVPIPEQLHLLGAYLRQLTLLLFKRLQLWSEQLHTGGARFISRTMIESDLKRIHLWFLPISRTSRNLGGINSICHLFQHTMYRAQVECTRKEAGYA